jgi:O-antigen/teichoic acid export membrane protein
MDYNIRRNHLINYSLKFILLILGFINIRITIDYLGKDLYGLWATIISIIGWINLTDLGIGNGLRNRLGEALAKDNKKEAKQLVSTAYISISIIMIIVFICASIIIYTLFLFDKISPTLLLPLFITLVGFCGNFTLGICRSIAYSLHRSGQVSIAQFLTSIFTVLGTYFISLFSKESLVLYSINNFLAIGISNIILSLIILNNRTELVPNISYFDRNKVKNIMDLGIKFFFLQLYVVIMFSTDNFIINHYINSSTVADYSIISRVYNSGNDLFSIMLITLWSAVTHAITNKNIDWIKKEKRKLLFMLIPYSIGCIFVGYYLNGIVHLWIGGNNNITFDSFTIIVFIINNIVLAWNGINVNILNGMGKLDLQLILCIVAAIINIPLSIFMIKVWGLGMAGVKLATVICLLITAIPLSIQVNNELKRNEIKKEILKREALF